METLLPLAQADIDGLTRLPADASLPTDGLILEAADVGASMSWRVAAGALTAEHWITIDLLATCADTPVFNLQLFEADAAPPFILTFALLPFAEARVRFPLFYTDQRQWLIGREGAWLKAMCGGAAIDPSRVTRVVLRLDRKGDAPTRWWMSAPRVTPAAPPRLDTPLLPRGPLLDAFGQSALRTWPGKTTDEATLVGHLRLQRAQSQRPAWPAAFSRWGGWRERQWDGTGWFRTQQRDGRWWLVDPDGHPFWSAGMDCVRAHIESCVEGLETALAWRPPPEPAVDQPSSRSARGVNYLGANLERAFGAEWKSVWDELVLDQLRATGFNTVGNWSDERMAARGRFPYVRPLPGFQPRHCRMAWRDFPDVFDPAFATDATAFAEALRSTADDPALVGYFLMNEPTWGFSSLSPAQGMLSHMPQGAGREALAEWLAERHADDAALAAAWAMRDANFARVRSGAWHGPFTPAAQRELEAFSTCMVQRLFDTLSAACRKVDPNHLNLGARYYTVPPDWALRGMTSFDVFSINGYANTAPEGGARVAAVANRPVLIGEWHFGALDAGLPASGIGRVGDQTARGAAYRYYVEQSAAKPWCVGAHWFTLYDQSAIGRFDGECYNIGFYDVCNQPYEPLCDAARETHARLYAVANGACTPFADPPAYLPKLFC